MTNKLSKGMHNNYTADRQESFEYLIDQTVLVRKSQLRHTRSFKYNEESDILHQEDERYPCVNSYYIHLEDSDPLAKVNILLTHPEKCVDKDSHVFRKNDAYSEKIAQQIYLESPPVSFIVLGKPDIGQSSLAKRLADYWNCVHIEPESLIFDEINSGSRAGQCIEFNLKCGRAVGADIVLKLLEKKTSSEEAKHKGVIISGFPMLPNDLYEEDPVSSESAIFTVRDIFDEIFNYACVASSRPQVSASSKINVDDDRSTLSENQDAKTTGSYSQWPTERTIETNFSTRYDRQLSFVFNLLTGPYLIVYVQCGGGDVVLKRGRYRFDHNDDEDGCLEDPYPEFRLKHLVQLPKDFEVNVRAQLDAYHQSVLPFLEAKVITHDPQCFIRVDGRLDISRILTVIKTKLKTMPIQRVLVPKKIIEDELSDDNGAPGIAEDYESPTSPKPTGENSSPISVFKELRRRHIPAKNFMWTLSDWGTKCPVSMTQGTLTDGSVKYPVQFMNQLFFLRDREAYLKFCSNPRPFLLPPYPRPSCKIFIFGPRLSGKSALAQCLAYFFNGTVLSTARLIRECMRQHSDEYLEKLKQKAIAEALTLLNEIRKNEAVKKEKERAENIKDWVKSVVALFEELIRAIEEKEREGTKAKFEISSFPMQMQTQAKKHEDESETTLAITKLKDDLRALNLPVDKLGIATWRSYLEDRRKFLTYLPNQLSRKVEAKPATVFDEFVKEYVDEALARAGLHEMGMSGTSITEMFLNKFKEIEEKNVSVGIGPGGWIVDGMLCNVELIKEFYPDYIGDEVIVLRDNGSYFCDRYERKESTFFSDFKTFFESVGAHDAAWRSPSLTSTQSDRRGMAEGIVSEILENQSFYVTRDDENRVSPRVEEYEKHLVDFQSNWDKINAFYEAHSVEPIVIDASDKSLPDIFEEAIRAIENRYRITARPLNEEDLAEELTLIPELHVGSKIDVEDVARYPLDEHRRYGSTSDFCPVTFHEHFVLWKGKEKFGAKFADEWYFMASQDDFSKFLIDPRRYLPVKYVESFPPPRVCVIGVSGCGKTRLSKSLAKNFGLFYVNSDVVLAECGPDQSPEALSRYWFAEPFKSTGFVIDDFPKRLADVEYMIDRKLIPDVILCLSADESYLISKFLYKHLKDWQKNVDKKREEVLSRYKRKLEAWKQQRKVRFDTLIEEKREKRYLIKTIERNRSPSLVSLDSVADQEDIDQVNKMLDEELPPILIEVPAANRQEAAAAAQALIEETVTNDLTNIAEIETLCLRELIPFQNVGVNLENFEISIMEGYLFLDPLKFRNRSLFERCYDVSPEVAQKLLDCGYYFLSKFGKTCPVQCYQNKNSVQMYLVSEAKNELYPVIHRSYIYFICGIQQRNIFKADPLKFISGDENFPLIPFKIAVIGPPKCGKTVLAKRIRDEFGFKVISRGEAVRNVLSELTQSELAMNMESLLRSGKNAPEEMLMKCVEAACFDEQAVTQGVVFDGFPNSASEVKYLFNLNLIPNLVIDLRAEETEILQCLSDFEMVGLKYSHRFIKHRYEEWKTTAHEFRKWFDQEYQSRVMVRIGVSIWSTWHRVFSHLVKKICEVKDYFRLISASSDRPLRLAALSVTPWEFAKRESDFHSFCPVCLHVSNVLVSGGEPPNRTGLVQFRQYFYWICPDHMEIFLKSPVQFLPPFNENVLPTDVPKRIELTKYPDNVYESGICAVCYKTKRFVSTGSITYASVYKENVYLFDSLCCLDNFLKQPQQFNFSIKFRQPTYPDLNYKDLPVLGMLEQYVASYIIQAISFVCRRRPIIPGLGIGSSALIGLGLHMNANNEKCKGYRKSACLEAFRLYNERRECLLNYVDVVKNHRNPFVFYQEPLPDFNLPPSESTESVTTMVSRIVDECVDDMDIYMRDDSSRVPVPDARFDYLCEYFKPLSKVPAFLNVVDIAGLVKGASEGQGLGNAFLSHISACDAIFHLCRAFEDDDVTHVDGEVNPVRDLDVISEELRLKDEDMLSKNLEKLERTVVRGGDKKSKPEYDTLMKIKSVLVDEKKHIRFGDWDAKDIEVLNRYLFLTSKPCMYLVNLSEKDYIKKKNKWLIKIKEWVDKNDPGALIIPFSGAFEHKLVSEYEDPILRKKYLEDVGATSALDKIIVQGYKSLQLEYFFTAGPDEVKAWTIQKGTKAPQAAGRIHTDFEKGFIMAEVMKFQDFKEEGSETACKAAGKYRQQGRNYTVEDGDIIFFKFNAGAGLQQAKKK